MNSMKRVVAGIFLNSEKKTLATYSKGAWYYPGGKVEEGENDEDCLIRELKEELGIEVNKDELEYYTIMEGNTHLDDKKISLSFYFVNTKGGEIKALREVTQIAWLSYNEIKDGRVITPLMGEITNKLKSEGFLV